MTGWAGEETVEVALGAAVRMLAGRLQLEQVDHVHKTDFQIGQPLAQDRGRRERLNRGDVAYAGHHYIGLASLIIGGPFPQPDALAAIVHRRIHRKVLRL